jgi:hypothetical protein
MDASRALELAIEATLRARIGDNGVDVAAVAAVYQPIVDQVQARTAPRAARLAAERAPRFRRKDVLEAVEAAAGDMFGELATELATMAFGGLGLAAVLLEAFALASGTDRRELLRFAAKTLGVSPDGL